MKLELLITNKSSKSKTYNIPFSRITIADHDCYSYSQTGAMELNNYVNSNIIEIGSKEVRKIIYDISKQENVNFSGSKNREEKEINIYVIYNGKKIKEGLKKK